MAFNLPPFILAERNLICSCFLQAPIIRQCSEVCIISHIQSNFFLKKKRETQVWNIKAKTSLMQDWKKTAKNLHEAFYILDKISHKSNFSPTEGGCSGKQLKEKRSAAFIP